MLNDLFINTLILISATLLSGHVLKELPSQKIKSTYEKIILGICGGALGILLIVYSINVAGSGTLLDLRVIALIMVNYAGGIIPTIISGIIIALYRIGHYGINISSLFAVMHILIYFAMFIAVDRTIKENWKKWFIKLFGTLFVLVSSFIYLLWNVSSLPVVIFSFAAAYTVVGAMEYFLVQYVHISNELFREYKKDSSKDFLTGLNNTRQFDMLLNSSLERAKVQNEKLSCLMLDIDHFKKVNDTYGHAVGDVVIKELAEILRNTCRSFDIISRVGGEEFCVLLPDCPMNHSFEVGMRIRNAVKSHSFSIGDGKSINITISIGSATYPENVEDLDHLVEKADDALYKAKRTGRDRVCSLEQCIVE